MRDRLSPEAVAAGLDPACLWHREAKQILTLFRKRVPTSTKRAPFSHAVMPTLGHMYLKTALDRARGRRGRPWPLCCTGWHWTGKVFVHEVVADGCDTRQQARENAWHYYHETFDAAHAALVKAGALPDASKKLDGRAALR